MNPTLTSRIIGTLGILFGAWWTWSSVVPPVIGIFSDDRDSSDIFFLLTIVPMMAIPGVLAIIFGIRLIREMKESSLKWVIGVFAVYFTFFLTHHASNLFPSLLPEIVQRSAYLFVASFIAIGTYLFAIQLLIRLLIQEKRTFKSLIGRGTLLLVAYLIWNLLSDLFREYAPTKAGYEHVHEEPWDILSLIIPILAAYGFYRFSSKRLVNADKVISNNDDPQLP